MADFNMEIDAVKNELAMVEHGLKTVREAAELDGFIDDEEQADIDEMEAIVAETRAYLKELQREAEAGPAPASDPEPGTPEHAAAVDEAETRAAEEEAAAQLAYFQEEEEEERRRAEEKATAEQASEAARAAKEEADAEESGSWIDDAVDLFTDDEAALSTAPEKEEKPTLGQDLLELHSDLFLAFKNAGDESGMLTAGQEAILEEMRIVSEELAIEAERTVLVHRYDLDDVAEGEALSDDELNWHEDQENPDYYDNDGVSEAALGDPDYSEDPSPYEEMSTDGIGNEDATIEELLDAGMSDENRLMMHGQLDQQMIDTRIEQIRKILKIHGTAKIEPTYDRDRLVGFNFDGEQANAKEFRQGRIYVDLVGNIVAHEHDTTSIPGEVLFLGVEIAASMASQVVEVIYDIDALYDATLEYAQSEDGSIVPLIVTAGAVLVPYTRAGKRFFKIGKASIEAGKLAAVIKRGVTGEALEGIGLNAARKEGSLLDELLENPEIRDSSSDLAKKLRNSPELDEHALREALEAAERGMAEEIAGGVVQKADPMKTFLDRKDVQDLLKRFEEEGLAENGAGIDLKKLRTLVGDGTKEEMALARESLSKQLQDKLDDRAFDELQIPGELPDDWQKHVDADVAKKYNDALDAANRKLGFKGTSDEVEKGLKNLAKLVHRGMQDEFAEVWARKAASSKAAQEKMDWVRKHLISIDELKKKNSILDPSDPKFIEHTEHIAELETQVNEIARAAFDNVRSAFWKDVSKNSAEILEEAGLKVSDKGNAPVLKSIGQSLTIEHKTRLKDDPLEAIYAGNMTFSFKYENSVLLEQRRKLIEDRMKELGHDGPIPWL